MRRSAHPTPAVALTWPSGRHVSARGHRPANRRGPTATVRRLAPRNFPTPGRFATIHRTSRRALACRPNRADRTAPSRRGALIGFRTVMVSSCPVAGTLRSPVLSAMFKGIGHGRLQDAVRRELDARRKSGLCRRPEGRRQPCSSKMLGQASHRGQIGQRLRVDVWPFTRHAQGPAQLEQCLMPGFSAAFSRGAAMPLRSRSSGRRSLGRPSG